MRPARWWCPQSEMARELVVVAFCPSRRPVTVVMDVATASPTESSSAMIGRVGSCPICGAATRQSRCADSSDSSEPSRSNGSTSTADGMDRTVGISVVGHSMQAGDEPLLLAEQEVEPHGENAATAKAPSTETANVAVGSVSSTSTGAAARYVPRPRPTCSPSSPRSSGPSRRDRRRRRKRHRGQRARPVAGTRRSPTASSRPSSIENYDWALRILSRRTRHACDCARSTSPASSRRSTTSPPDEGARGKPVSRRTLKLMRSTLSQALDLAVRRKMLAYNPARMAELTPTAARTEHRRALTPDQAARCGTSSRTSGSGTSSD